MGALFSKSSKTQQPKDPRWQGIGPNTPLPSSSANPEASGFNRHGGLSHQQPRSHTSPNNARTPAAKANKSSKIMLLLKLDPKAGRGQRRVISKNLISLPSDFRHTGHIGAGEVRSGQIDPEKIKNQMMEVAASLKLDLNSPMPVLKTVPVQVENRENVYAGPEQVDRYSTRPTAEVAF